MFSIFCCVFASEPLRPRLGAEKRLVLARTHALQARSPGGGRACIDYFFERRVQEWPDSDVLYKRTLSIQFHLRITRIKNTQLYVGKTQRILLILEIEERITTQAI